VVVAAGDRVSSHPLRGDRVALWCRSDESQLKPSPPSSQMTPSWQAIFFSPTRHAPD
jgi:hypothetical protein